MRQHVRKISAICLCIAFEGLKRKDFGLPFLVLPTLCLHAALAYIVPTMREKIATVSFCISSVSCA